MRSERRPALGALAHVAPPSALALKSAGSEEKTGYWPPILSVAVCVVRGVAAYSSAGRVEVAGATRRPRRFGVASGPTFVQCAPTSSLRHSVNDSCEFQLHSAPAVVTA